MIIGGQWREAVRRLQLYYYYYIMIRGGQWREAVRRLQHMRQLGPAPSRQVSQSASVTEATQNLLTRTTETSKYNENMRERIAWHARAVLHAEIIK